MNTYKTDKEFQSKICNIRCELEELAEYAHNKWLEQPDGLIPIASEDWEEISQLLQDHADAIATNFETNEDN